MSSRKREQLIDIDITSYAGFLLMESAKCVHLNTARALEAMKITPRELGLLLVLLKSNVPMTQSSLGGIAKVDRTTMVQMIDELSRKGLVERKHSDSDRRIYHLLLTSDGKIAAKNGAKAARNAQDAFWANSKDSNDWKKLSAILIRALEKVPLSDGELATSTAKKTREFPKR